MEIAHSSPFFWVQKKIAFVGVEAESDTERERVKRIQRKNSYKTGIKRWFWTQFGLRPILVAEEEEGRGSTT